MSSSSREKKSRTERVYDRYDINLHHYKSCFFARVKEQFMGFDEVFAWLRIWLLLTQAYVTFYFWCNIYIKSWT
jgi:hypothetical protein